MGLGSNKFQVALLQSSDYGVHTVPRRCAIACMNFCAHVSQALVSTPLLEQTKIQHTLGQPLKAEYGCPSGRRVENCHRYAHAIRLPANGRIISIKKKEEEEEKELTQEDTQQAET